MMRHRFDPLCLAIGLSVITVGVAGWAGSLDVRELGRSWLVPAVVVIAGLGLLVSAVRVPPR
jgi:hypothetical protein